MARIANAFKYRAGDAPVIDTGLFLHLYVPTLLNLIKHDDLHAPKLLIVRGSPGSGKSSMLRLFQVDTLLALRGKPQSGEQEIVERLRELGAWGDDGPLAVGIYLQCDSSVRDLANIDADGANIRLLNTLLDIRILLTFLRSLERLQAAKALEADVDGLAFQPLPPDDAPPPLFAIARTVRELREQCERIEADFAVLLNSFPGDPMPESIRPHARVFAIPYLAAQVKDVPALKGLVPMVMLDNLQDLYDKQRDQVRDEFLRRAAIPRWVSVRKHVYELEDLIPLEGSVENRDYREVDLDNSSTGDFRRFVAGVAERRWDQSDGLRQFSTQTFRSSLLEEPSPPADKRRAERQMAELVDRLNQLGIPTKAESLVVAGEDENSIATDQLLRAEGQLIVAERKAAKGQLDMFPAMAEEPSDSKTEEAARLFMARRLKLPYYHSFDTLVDAANGNIEQFLAIAAVYADKMILRGEVRGDPTLSPREQHDLLRRSGDEYYDRIEQRYDMGYAIRTLVDNLGQFFEAVTYRPAAPYAPGVNGFGLTRQQLHSIVAANSDPALQSLAVVLRRAVAENVVFARSTKQGKAGAEKIVFYLNRLLCVRFGLPLNTGGWQHIPVKTLAKMVAGPVPAKEWGKKWTDKDVLFEAGG
jgi:hypothetical protein